MAELRSEDCAPTGISTLVEGDRDLFSAEGCGFQKSLCVSTRVGLQNESAVSRCFDFNISSATDSGDLFLWPEHVHPPKGDTVITGFHNQIGARGRYKWLRSRVRAGIFRRVSNSGLGGRVSRVQAWVSTPGEVTGRARVIAGGGGRSRAGVGGQRRAKVSSWEIRVHGRGKFGGQGRVRVGVRVILTALLPRHGEEVGEGEREPVGENETYLVLTKEPGQNR